MGDSLGTQNLGSCVNFSKIAAYTVKWILREKPIMVRYDYAAIEKIRPSKSSLKKLTYINELYAMYLVLFIFNLQCDGLYERISLRNTEVESLANKFKFHRFSENYFELFMDSMQVKIEA